MLKRMLEMVVGVVLVLSSLYWLGGGIPMKAGVPMSDAPSAMVVNSLAALAELLIGLLIIGHTFGNVKAMMKSMAGVIVLAVLLTGISVAGAAEKGDTISFLSPNIIRVVATESDHLGGNPNLSGVYPFEGYGESLSKALLYIGEKYDIKSITPIVYVQSSGTMFAAGATKMLIVIVEPIVTPAAPKPKK